MTPKKIAPTEKSFEEIAAEIVAKAPKPSAFDCIRAAVAALSETTHTNQTVPQKLAAAERRRAAILAEIDEGEKTNAIRRRFAAPGLGPDVDGLRRELADQDAEIAKLKSEAAPPAVVRRLVEDVVDALKPIDAFAAELRGAVLEPLRAEIDIAVQRLAGLVEIADRLGVPVLVWPKHPTKAGAPASPLTAGSLADLISLAFDLRGTIRAADRALDRT